jgi:hypothetical protein
MATWVPHLRLTYGGTIGTSTTETWSNTIRFHLMTFVPTVEQLTAGAAACETPLKAWLNADFARISSTAKLNWIKLNWVLSNGQQRDQQTIVHDLAAPFPGKIVGGSPPWYQTVALTFRTRQKRGRGHAGRIFPPLVTVAIAADQPYISAVDASNMASQGKTLLTGLRSAMATSWQAAGGEIPVPAVFSPGDGAGKNPLFVPITGVTVDRVPDVQHRRTKQVPRAESGVSLLDP